MNAKYDEKNKRLDDAVSFQTPDMVPLAPMDDTFGIAYAGHTMSEGLYNFDVGANAVEKVTEDFDFDLCNGTSNVCFGYGPALDAMGLKLLQWAGEKDSVCTDMSIHQYVEKEYMKEDDYDEFFTDMSGYVMRKILPQIMTCAAPLANVHFENMFGMGSMLNMYQFANPKILEAFQSMQRSGSILIDVLQRNALFEKRIMEKGYPMFFKGMTFTAFDFFSDCLRGTLGISMDMMEQPENVHRAIEIFHRAAIAMFTATASQGNGKFVFIPCHKGIDMFMSDETYAEFYWPTLKDLVEKIVEAGYIPYIHTEGPYYTRLKYLEELPEHKCVIAFTDMDMKKVKDTVGRHNCITGGFDEHLLEIGTKDQVTEEVKRILDICAPGGGYIFAVDRTLDCTAKPENVEAMCEAVRKYGKY